MPGGQLSKSQSLVDWLVLLDLGVIGGSINPNFRAPKAKTNVFIRYEFFQIQLAPAMQTEATKQILDSI